MGFTKTPTHTPNPTQTPSDLKLTKRDLRRASFLKEHNSVGAKKLLKMKIKHSSRES